MVYRIGDTTRPMTCTVLLELVDEGKVNPTDKVNKTLPQIQGIEGITYEQLCQNTSGLGSYKPALNAQFVTNPTRNWSMAEILANGLASGSRTAPGALFNSSDTGYILLVPALQELTGESCVCSTTTTSSPTRDVEFIVPGGDHGRPCRVPTRGATRRRDRRRHLPVRHPDRRDQAVAVDGVDRGRCRGPPSTTCVATRSRSRRDPCSTTAPTRSSGKTLSPPVRTSRPGRSFGIGAVQLGPMRGQAGAIPGLSVRSLLRPGFRTHRGGDAEQLDARRGLRSDPCAAARIDRCQGSPGERSEGARDPAAVVGAADG